MPMTPEQLAKSGTEHAHQRAVFGWAQQNMDKYPDIVWLFAIPNGGKRDKITAGKLKAEGVKAGVPDICLPVRRSHSGCLFIELKKPADKTRDIKKGTIQNNQNRWAVGLTSVGQAVCVCYGWEETVAVLRQYLEST